MSAEATESVRAWRIGDDAGVLAHELAQRGVPLDTALDAIGVMLENDPNAANIIALWMQRMMMGA